VPCASDGEPSANGCSSFGVHVQSLDSIVLVTLAQTQNATLFEAAFLGGVGLDVNSEPIRLSQQALSASAASAEWKS
jgi:hypothetical protein